MITDEKGLRAAFGSFMTGITVVTATTSTGQPVGFTANSFTSVSLKPPLLLVCPARSLQCFPVFNSCESFAISILADNQHGVSNIFAQAIENRFDKIAWRNDSLNNPLIDNAITHFSCKVFSRVEAGDHIILIGEIVDFVAQGGLGLGYANGAYFTQSLEVKTLELLQNSKSLRVGAIVEYKDKIFISKQQGSKSLPNVPCDSLQQAPTVLKNFLGSVGLTASVSQVYSIFQDKNEQYFMYYRCHAKEGEARLEAGEYENIENLDSKDFFDYPVQSMMERYITEKKNAKFGIYIGDERDGVVDFI